MGSGWIVVADRPVRRVLGQDPRLNSGDLGMGRTHMWARIYACEKTHKNLDMGWGFGIVAAVFRLVHCGVTPGVDLFCLRGFLLEKGQGLSPCQIRHISFQLNTQ